MKRIIAIFAILCMLTALVACTDPEKDDDKGTPEVQTTQEPGYYEEEEQTFPSIPLN